jgi:hypothetical protein
VQQGKCSKREQYVNMYAAEKEGHQMWFGDDEVAVQQH